MKEHATAMFEAIQRGDFTGMGQLVRKTWEQNKALDCGTNPETVESIIRQIEDFTLGYKLPGAGGGGIFIWSRRIRKLPDILSSF